MPISQSAQDRFRRSSGHHEAWQYHKNGGAQEQKIFNKRVANMAARPGLHSGNQHKQDLAETLVNFAAFISSVQPVAGQPAISAKQAEKLNLERKITLAEQKNSQSHHANKRNINIDSGSFQPIITGKGSKNSIQEGASGMFNNRGRNEHLLKATLPINQHSPLSDDSLSKYADSMPGNRAGSFSAYRRSTLPMAEATPIGKLSVESIIRDSKTGSVIINQEEKKASLLSEINNYLVANGKMDSDRGKELTYFMQTMAKQHPVLVAPLALSGYKNGRFAMQRESKEVESATGPLSYSAEIVNHKQQPCGRLFSFLFDENPNPLTGLSVRKKLRTLSGKKTDNKSAFIMSIGVDSTTAKVIARAKQHKRFQPETDDDLRQLTFSPVLQRILPEENDFSDFPEEFSYPVEMSESIPAAERAAFYINDEQKGRRTEILLEVLQKNPVQENEKVYLRPHGGKNEFYTFRIDGESNALTERVFVLDESDMTWRDKETSELIDVIIKTGSKQIKIFDTHYNVEQLDNGRYLLELNQREGGKRFLPVYMEPLTKRWHLGLRDGEVVFSYAQEEIIDNLKEVTRQGYKYVPMYNDNPIFYGKGIVLRKEKAGGNSNYPWGKYIEMNGELVPVRHTNHTGHGIVYEVFDEKNPQKSGFPVKYDGTCWQFEKNSSFTVSSDLAIILKDKVGVGNIDFSQLSVPDEKGIRTNRVGQRYLKYEGNFFEIKDDEEGTYLTVDKEKIYLDFRHHAFHPVHNVEESDDLMFKDSRIKRDSPGDCPDWRTLRRQLENISHDNKIVTIRHRGDFDSRVAENSLTAFRNSYLSCRAGIETDVRTTKDGELVIFHDTHIGKMMEPAYNPDRDTGPNKALNEMTLAELKQKKLLDPRRRPTDDTIITVRELIRDYQSQQGQSLFYLEVKDPDAILKTAKIVSEEAESNPSLLNRIVIKFNMAEFPTYADWVSALQDVGASPNIMANPVMSPKAAERINKLPEIKIDLPPGETLHDNACRAVYDWSSARGKSSGLMVPNVEVVIKSVNDGFKNTIEKVSKQGRYRMPVSLDISNTEPGSMANMVAIVKKNGKALGTYLPIPDRIMWASGVTADVTVPHALKPGERIDIQKAFFTNKGACCTDQKTMLAPEEKEDIRGNLNFQISIGANVVTVDDSDSVDIEAEKQGVLDKVSMPYPLTSFSAMNSRLASELKLVPEIAHPNLNIKAYGGKTDSYGNVMCIYDDMYNTAFWTYPCEQQKAYDEGYSDRLALSVKETDRGPGLQIFSTDGSYCLDVWGKGTKNCGDNKDTLFNQTIDGGLRALYKDDPVYLTYNYGWFNYKSLPHGSMSWDFYMDKKNEWEVALPRNPYVKTPRKLEP